MARNFLSDHKVVVAKVATADGTSDAATSIIDTAGYQGVAFVATVHTPGAGNAISAQQHTLNQTSGMAAIAGSSIATGTGTDAMTLVCSVDRPRERYVRAVVTRGVSTTVSEILAILYGAKDMPQVSDTATLLAEQFVNTAEGTA
jgi:hypothetical protein